MIDARWCPRVASWVNVALGVLTLVQFSLATLMIPWLLGIWLWAIVIEAGLTLADANSRGSPIGERPRPMLSSVLWLSASASPRPLHGLFCIGAILVLRVCPRRTGRVVAAAIALGLGAMAWLSPAALLAPWSDPLPFLYRPACALAAVPFILFALARTETP